jgi:hypothetical protein
MDKAKQNSFNKLNNITTEYMKLEDELLAHCSNVFQARQILAKMGELNVDYYIAEQKHQERFGPINPAFPQKRRRWYLLGRRR